MRRCAKRDHWGQHECPEVLVSDDDLCKLRSVWAGKCGWLQKV